jgi:hypothetical protein
MRASSTLAILLFFGVVVGIAVGILDAFGNSISRGGLKAFGYFVAFFTFSSLAGLNLASTSTKRFGS